MKIEVKNLIKKYDGKCIIYPNMKFEEGNIYVVSGENGTGKTTLLLMLAQFEKYEEGKIYFDNLEYKKMNLIKKNQLRKSSTYISTFTRFNDELTVKENLKEFLSNEDFEIFKKYNIDINQLITHLSGGEIELLSFYSLKYSRLKLILLDELTIYLDDNYLSLCIEILNLIKKDKIIIFSSHDKRLLNSKDFIQYKIN